MGRPRFIPIKLTVDGRDIDALEARVSKLNKQFRGSTAGFTGADMPRLRAAGRGSGPSDAERAAERQVKAELRAAGDVARIRAQTARSAEVTDRVIARSAKAMADVRTREMRRSADDFLRLLDRERKAHDLHVSNLKKGAALVGTALLAAGAVALSTLEEAFQRAASFDALKRGLNTQTGAPQETERQLLRLRELAKAPGVTYRQAIEGSTSLQATGMNAQFAERSIKAFGNALAIVGRNTRENMQGVFLAVQQISNSPFLQGDELRQLQERLPQVSKLLQDAFGTARSEELKEMGVTSQRVLEAIVSGLEKLPRAGGGATTALEDIADAYDIALVTFGEPLLEPVSRELNEATTLLENNRDTFREWGQGVGDILRGVRQLAESEIGSFIGWLAKLTITLDSYVSAIGMLRRLGASSRPAPSPAAPAVTDIFDAGNAVKVDPKNFRPLVTMSKEARKALEKQADVVADLRREIEFFGDRSAVAATKQKLLSMDAKELNRALEQQALRYAAVIDRMRDAADVQELIRKKLEETEDYKKGLGDKLRDVAHDARERTKEINRELLGFNPSERFKFDNSVLGQEAAGVGAGVKADLDDAREALDALDQVAVRIEPFRKRKAAMEALTASARSLSESMYDAASPAEDKFEEFTRQLERDENLPERFAGRVREARRELEAWQGNPLLVTPEQSQRAADFERIFSALLTAVNDGRGKITLTAAEVADLARKYSNAAGSALDFDKALREKQALESYTSAMKDLEQVINKDVMQTNAQRVEKLLLTDAYKHLTDAQREGLRLAAGEADVAEQTRKAADAAREKLEDLTSIFEGGLQSAWEGKWRGLFDYVRREFERMLAHLLAKWLASKFLRALSGGGADSGPSGGGFSLRNLFNVGGGAQGTPPFVPSGRGGQTSSLTNAGGLVQTFRQRGLVGGLKSLIGLGSSAAGAATSFAGSGLGAGTSAATSLGVHEALHTGAATSAGGGGLGSMVGLLTNPWTLAAVGAAVAGFALWKHFSHGTEKQLKKAIRSEYALDVKDMATLSEVKKIGESYYGKGQVNKHIPEVIRLDAVKDLLASYAEQSNQYGSKLLTDRQLADASDPRNNFIARATGGPVTKGQPYIVGDRGPRQYWEVFVPKEDGRIEPSVESYQRRRGSLTGRVIADVTARARAASVPPSSGQTQGGQPQGGMSPAVAAALMGVLGRVADAIGGLEAIDPDSLVSKARPATVAAHAARGFGESSRAKRDAQDSLGLGTS